MTPWPQAIASFYLSGTVLLLLLLANLSESGQDSASTGIVVLSAMGLIVGLVVTVVRLLVSARAARHPDVARRWRPRSEPVDHGRAVRWAAIGAVGLLLLVVADRLTEYRAVRLTVLVVGVVLVGLSYWCLWRAPLRPVVSPGIEGEVQGARSES